MSSQPVASNGIPLPAGRTALLDQLTAELDAPALWWLSGYTAGLAQRHAPALAVVRPAAAPISANSSITVVFGSQTGNAKRLAESIATRIEGSGRSVRLVRADAYLLRELTAERHLLLVMSTQGDGDPPDDAREFVEHLLGKRAQKLPELQFAVLGLGDSSYPKFCEIGRRLDARLVELGASRWLDRADADLDIEAIATPWIDRITALAGELDAANQPSSHPATSLATITPLRPSITTPTFSREHPFAAELLVDQRITGCGSDKDVRHIELSLQGSGLTYETGDALGVWPTQAADLVDAVLVSLQLDGDASVAHTGQTLPLRDWLTQHRELTRLTRSFIAAHAQRAGDAQLQRLLGEDARDELVLALNDWQLIDLLLRHPASWSADDLVTALRPLQPRLYSIASSMQEVGEQAHLTVAHAQWQRDGAPRHGVASHYLTTRGEGAKLRVFIERNAHFRLPSDGARDIIMVGAGTGIAPFRGFVQARTVASARGRNWLVFGNPHARGDFLYQLEWQRALKESRLHRLDVAFSRDGRPLGTGKPYVQDRIREHGRELLAWLESGAHLYVCGAVAMGKGVHAALLDVLATHAGHDSESAEAYLRELQRQGRYAKDVY